MKKCIESVDPQVISERLSALATEKPGALCKGIPVDFKGCFADIGNVGLSLKAENIPLPVAFLKTSAMNNNRAWMQRFLAMSKVSLAPHSKTTMAPELFAMQLDDGVWAMTAATAQHARFLMELGIKRIILANQLVGHENIRLVLDGLLSYEDIDFYCLVDSCENATVLAEEVRKYKATPLQVLLEIGIPGGRTGVRSVHDALELAQLVRTLSDSLALRGIETYEGIVSGEQKEKEQQVRSLLSVVCQVATACDKEGLFAQGEVLLTAGGTEFFDMAAEHLHSMKLSQQTRTVIRSGCYISHDSLAYKRSFTRMLERSPGLEAIKTQLEPALEVWAAIQSRPEAELAFANIGKRDISYDWDMPVPLYWFRPQEMQRPQPLPSGHKVTKLNDQHTYLEIPADSPLKPGDMVGFGISHACTTFDKWQCLLAVDDDYQVTSAVRTFF